MPDPIKRTIICKNCNQRVQVTYFEDMGQPTHCLDCGDEEMDKDKAEFVKVFMQMSEKERWKMLAEFMVEEKCRMNFAEYMRKCKA